MSESRGMASMKCPICGSWDTVLEFVDLYSFLYCRQCGDGHEKLVWEAQYELDAEWVYYADGSIRESLFQMNDAIRDWVHKQPKEYDKQGLPIEHSYDEIWPKDQLHRVKVRFFTPDEFEARWSKNDPADTLVCMVREFKKQAAQEKEQ